MKRATSREIDELIQRTCSGDKQAQERLFGQILRSVKNMRFRPLGPYSRDPDCVAEVCARVVTRLIENDFQRLRHYQSRPSRFFWSWLQVVATRISIDLARSMRQNIASRNETEFRWITEVELIEPHEVDDPNPTSRLSLLDVYLYLYLYADPTDVDMLQQSVQSSKSWQEIARPHNIRPHTARQRVRRLRKTLREWVQRREP